ncbi:Predicted kinase, aminoglycoside phosphotransferase (APT) family [Marininema mesophilum]|uniref:Predicted kinase, aminoglycoside phosphotransferase (APT) family n=1 Tax=Marininema mesophilum TaxID=1048340 RepID=A0A1H2UTT6_9BACL|nr:phosphotransferase [Marininema mesophilum]SDW59004.1 Predicted kinase, aminoglycoside phosphotransferase (APT) family [Marininema mesophilum]
MTQPWKAEREVHEKEARELIIDQFPHLSPLTLSRLGEGYDNTVYLVNHQYVFRFPRRKIAVPLLEAEGRILPELVDLLPIAMPCPLFYGQPTRDYPWPFIGYSLVSGQTPGPVLKKGRRESTLRLAEFLRKLHSFPIERAREKGVPNDMMARMDINKYAPTLQQYLEKFKNNDLLRDPAPLTKYVFSLQPIQVNHHLALVHGDLHIRNILVDEDEYLSGVIDWGDIHIGHPALDLSIVYSFLPIEERECFFAHYGEVEEESKKIAQFKAIFASAALLRYGYEQGDEQLVKTTQTCLELALG